MSRVGSSIVSGGSGRGLSGSQIVSPISALSRPTMAHTSPARISSTSLRPRRSNSSTCTTVSLNADPSACRTTITFWFLRIFPANTRPTAILPTNSLYCSAITCIWSGAASSTSGAGTWFRMASKNGRRSFGGIERSVVAIPLRPLA